MASWLDQYQLKPGTEIKAGSPEYTQAVVQNTARSLKNPYQAAMEDLRQTTANRGGLEGGVGLQQEAQLGQNYLDRLSSTAEKAAIQGADLAEQNRQRAENRQWQIDDMNRRYQELEKQAAEGREAEGRNRWSNLLGGVAGAAGTMFGGPILGAAGGYVANSIFGNKNQTPPPTIEDVNYVDQNAPWNTNAGPAY